MINMVPDIDVQAEAGQPFTGKIVNPAHMLDGKSQHKRPLATPASTTSIEASTPVEFEGALKAQFKNYSTNFVVTYTGNMATMDFEKIIQDYVSAFGEENEYIDKTIIFVDYLSSGYKNNRKSTLSLCARNLSFTKTAGLEVDFVSGTAACDITHSI